MGSQAKTTVTIIDDDMGEIQMTSPNTDAIRIYSNDSKLSVGISQTHINGDDDSIFVYFLSKDDNGATTRRKGKPKRDNDGTLKWFLDDFSDVINHTAHFLRLKPYGLIGHYFETEDHFATDPSKARVDRTINFTAFESGVKFVRWEGFLRSSRSDLMIFSVQARKSRLWIDGFLIIDEWIDIDSDKISTGCYHLNANELYAISLEVHVMPKDSVKVFWGSRNVSMKIIQPRNFYFQTRPSEFDIIKYA